MSDSTGHRQGRHGQRIAIAETPEGISYGEMAKTRRAIDAGYLRVAKKYGWKISYNGIRFDREEPCL